MLKLVLASTSPFRRELLAKLHLPFDVASPETDETPLPEESAPELVQRLSEAKARAVAAEFSDALVIGSDQVAVLDGKVLGKPGSHPRAVEQLSAASGKIVTFYTGLCLLNSTTGDAQVDVIPFRVHFRLLGGSAIENYLQREQPYNCAGSFKSEGLGISLFSRLEGADPNALIGLPLIRLIDMLAAEGVHVI